MKLLGHEKKKKKQGTSLLKDGVGGFEFSRYTLGTGPCLTGLKNKLPGKVCLIFIDLVLVEIHEIF